MMDKLQSVASRDQCRNLLEQHEDWYRKIRVSKNGAPAIDQEEIQQVEPLVNFAIEIYTSGNDDSRKALRTFFAGTDPCAHHLEIFASRIPVYSELSSMKDFLSAFQKSKYFQESVAPSIAKTRHDR